MARIKRAVFGVLIALALCGCTCGLAVCTDAEAKTSNGSRFEVETDLLAFGNTLAVDILTDTETGRQWVVVCTTHGVAMTPLEGGKDGTVSRQH